MVIKTLLIKNIHKQNENAHIFAVTSTSTFAPTTLNNTLISAKIDTLNDMVDSIDDVQDAISTATSSKRQRSTSITCSDFIDLVTSYSAIADDISQSETMIALGETIRKLNQSNCNNWNSNDFAV